MMRFTTIITILSFCFALSSGCKNSKKATNDSTESVETPIAEAKEVKEEPKEAPVEPEAASDVEVSKAEEEAIKKHTPLYPDSLYFRMEKTPCFGQCPVYTVNIYSSGHALLEGKKFFDYEGFYTTKFSEDELIQIEKIAMKYGYSKMKHIYDAPVTDLPSSTTIVQTENISNWVYNRMNSPDELRSFELEMETMIKDKQWTLSKKGAVKQGSQD